VRNSSLVEESGAENVTGLKSIAEAVDV